jgi:hypothetical protein
MGREKQRAILGRERISFAISPGGHDSRMAHSYMNAGLGAQFRLS